MSLGLYIRYQELIGKTVSQVTKNSDLPHVDVLMPIEEFLANYVDTIQAECLLNCMGTWVDNGVTENDDPLLQRVYKIVSEENLDFEKKKLQIDAVGHDYWANPA